MHINDVSGHVVDAAIEIKAVAKILPIQVAQLLSQLKLSDHRVGLLINFNVARLKDGIVRIVNRL
jgi:GxxExxY protein